MFVRSNLRSVLFAPLFAAASLGAEEGKLLFTTHCAACHMPDRQLVGPSLVEVRRLYADKLDEFLAWCREPQQKRQGVIQMPPMGHVGENNLKLIHAYIVEAAAGLKEVKVTGLDPFYAAPSMRKRPQVQRIFMPEAGPAAIAVAVNDTLHYCWDAGECRLRYVWKGDFIDGWEVWRANGNALAKIQGDILLREESSPLPFLDDSASSPPSFLGYRIKNGLPTFRYRAGGREISETIVPGPDGETLQRRFTIQGNSEPLRLQLTPSDQVEYSCDAGTRDGDVLTLAPAEANEFTITLTPR